jgi:hypothetical protein
LGFVEKDRRKHCVDIAIIESVLEWGAQDRAPINPLFLRHHHLALDLVRDVVHLTFAVVMLPEVLLDGENVFDLWHIECP